MTTHISQKLSRSGLYEGDKAALIDHGMELVKRGAPYSWDECLTMINADDARVSLGHAATDGEQELRSIARRLRITSNRRYAHRSPLDAQIEAAAAKVEVARIAEANARNRMLDLDVRLREFEHCVSTIDGRTGERRQSYTHPQANEMTIAEASDALGVAREEWHRAEAAIGLAIRPLSRLRAQRQQWLVDNRPALTEI